MHIYLQSPFLQPPLPPAIISFPKTLKKEHHQDIMKTRHLLSNPSKNLVGKPLGKPVDRLIKHLSRGERDE